ncbi:hypothetical protein O3G_MSEX014816 [Manduca sexta]|uniref:Uncharacterized protein n=1 Tax=Manduca sexta TaxID=7130 RepID=A0A921ZX58_MANSE|nr:hypothetical protein O3G_MSEX014816 [Manduca sexta]
MLSIYGKGLVTTENKRAHPLALAVSCFPQNDNTNNDEDASIHSPRTYSCRNNSCSGTELLSPQCTSTAIAPAPHTQSTLSLGGAVRNKYGGLFDFSQNDRHRATSFISCD